MRALALTLALLTTAVQTVGWVECCCTLICKHHNDPCKKDCKDKPKADTAKKPDCCGRKAAAPATPKEEKRCSHVEPSSEVVSQTADLPHIDFHLVLILPIIPAIPAPTALHCIAAASEGEIRGSPPLHLLYSVFLI